jgi:hypothetical protein
MNHLTGTNMIRQLPHKINPDFNLGVETGTIRTTLEVIDKLDEILKEEGVKAFIYGVQDLRDQLRNSLK